MNVSSLGGELAEVSRLRRPFGGAMLSNSWECRKVRQFALRPMGKF